VPMVDSDPDRVELALAWGRGWSAAACKRFLVDLLAQQRLEDHA
jgi:hypothetical protein